MKNMNNKIKIYEAPMGIKGFVQIKRLATGTAEYAREWAEKIKELRRNAFLAELQGEKQIAQFLEEKAAEQYRAFWRMIQDHTLEIASENHNLVMTSSERGVNLILRALGNKNNDLTTNALAIGHAELGTGNTAPASTDTQLTTPGDRQTLTLASMTSLTSLKLQFFWANAELANATYKEIGTFSAGTATLSSGRLMNHALLTPNYAKGSNEDTTMEVNYTLTAVT